MKLEATVMGEGELGSSEYFRKKAIKWAAEEIGEGKHSALL